MVPLQHRATALARARPLAPWSADASPRGAPQLAWVGTAFLLLRTLRKRFHKDEGNIFVRLRPLRPINVPALMRYIADKPVVEEDRRYRHRYGDEAAGMGAGGLSGKGGASARGMITSRWTEEDKEEWGGVCPDVEVQVDETNGCARELRGPPPALAADVLSRGAGAVSQVHDAAQHDLQQAPCQGGQGADFGGPAGQVRAAGPWLPGARGAGGQRVLTSLGRAGLCGS